MSDVFAERLSASGRRFTPVRGDRAGRLTAALAAIDGLLAEGFGLAP
jgi:hypothetical protein